MNRQEVITIGDLTKYGVPLSRTTRAGLPSGWAMCGISDTFGMGKLYDTSAWTVETSSVQQSLNQLGYGPLDVDGSDGPMTDAAVRRFQSDHGLAVDGIVGPDTAGALSTALGGGGGGDLPDPVIVIPDVVIPNDPPAPIPDGPAPAPSAPDDPGSSHTMLYVLGGAAILAVGAFVVMKKKKKAA